MTNELKHMFLKEERRSSSTAHSSSHDINTTTTGKQNDHIEYSPHKQHHQEPFSNQYNVNLQYDSVVPEAGRPTKLTISITEKSGATVREYELVHDKIMHLIIVGDDLSYFAHIHPTIESTKASFTITHTFPESGKYKLWVDFKPKGGNQTIVTFITNVIGLPVHKPMTLIHDGNYIKKSVDEKYQINLNLPERVIANNDVKITFNISDTTGNPITDLEPLMGAGGHTVIISNDMNEFLHVHPTEEVEHSWKRGPDISFKTNFPKQGLYKAWGQFQHQGRIIIADFTLKVS
jgi:hypothetical protein